MKPTEKYSHPCVLSLPNGPKNILCSFAYTDENGVFQCRMNRHPWADFDKCEYIDFDLTMRVS